MRKVTPIKRKGESGDKFTTRDLISPIVPSKVAAIVANEMNRLFQAHEIVALAVHGIGDEVDNGGPAIKHALQGAADIIFASIEALESISIRGKVLS